MPKSDLLASICCLTHNHEKYIRQALDGFLMQKTDFSIEIILHDDASTDGTPEIVREYAAKHPGLFRPIYQRKNLYSSGTGIYQIYTQHVFPLARGKYIAICEGDDYWTDPLKLQKQIDFLEQNRDYAICFHKAGFTGDEPTDFLEHEKYYSNLFSQKADFGFKDLILDNFIPNCSAVYRNSIKIFPPFFNKCIFPDWPLHLIYSQTGKIRFLDELMAVHYKHKNGVWEGKTLEARILGGYQFYTSLLRYSQPVFYPDILQALEKHTRTQVIPEFSEVFNLGHTLGKNQEKQNTEKLQNDLNQIFESQSWKLANFVRRSAALFFPSDSKRRQIAKSGYHFAKARLKNLKLLSQKIQKSTSVISEVLHRKTIQNQKWPDDKPLVSVIIPNFNYGKYIGETIASVLDQTFQNFEVIIVDGGSSDPETIRVLNEIRHPKIQVHFREGRHLVGDNRNFGITLSKGKYICCLDADDMIEPTYLEKALYFLEAFQYDVVYPWVKSFGKSNTIWQTETLSFEEMMTRGNPVATVAVFTKAAWNTSGGYKDWPVGKDHIPEDWEFWTRLAGHGFRFKHFPEALMLYRTHDESLTALCGTTHEKQLEVIRRETIALNHRKFKRIRDRNHRKTFIVSNPFINLKQPKSRKRILLALPFMITGGVDTLFLNVFSHFAKTYDISIVTTLESDKKFGDNTLHYQKITREIYHLPNFLDGEDQMKKFILYLILSKEIDLIFMAGSEFTYHCLPALKSGKRNLKVADFLFNETGHIVNNRKYSHLIDMNIVENEKIQSLLIEKYNENPNKILLIHNGINLNSRLENPDMKAIREKHNIAQHSFVVAFLGRISEEKNPQALIGIAQKTNDAGIVFFMGGNGPMYNEMLALVDKNGLRKSILAPGFVDAQEILALADMLILPSKIDGRPNIVLEALAAGVPVIASDVGGLPTLIVEGYNGFLLKSENIEGFAEKIQLLKNNKELSKAMKLNARNYAIENLDDKIMHGKYAVLLENLLGTYPTKND